MVSIGALWLPILVAAILVFVLSAVVWMVLPHHKNDFRGLVNEEEVRRALSAGDVAPGLYTVPHAPTREAYQEPEMQKKFEEGPNAFITVLPRGLPSMGRQFAQWFAFLLVVGAVCAFVVGRALAPGAEYMSVFRLTAVVAWAAYGFAIVQDAIWFGRPWGFVGKHLMDALAYGLVTAGAFGWLWP